MADRFEVRIGQTWYIRGSNKGKPCDVFITIKDMYVAALIGEPKLVYKYDYLFDGELAENKTGFSDLHEELFEKDWVLQEPK